MNEWFVYCVDRRAELICQTPMLPEQPSSEQMRWYVFCAASAYYLSERYGLPCPDWVSSVEPLESPWYDAEYVDDEVRRWLEQTTPKAFVRYLIYCGANVYLDKESIVERVTSA